jgi:5'-3' exoribonuclease 1
MGIPSYYKKLADHVKGLVGKSYVGKASALYFDFNCMIYHVARRPNSSLPPYPGYDGKEDWEKALLDDIVKYVVKVWQDVGKPKEVLLAIDGVVPMAKIKQQRLRRFKSVWLTEEEKKEGTRKNIPSWDTNCITPGTPFMRKLNARLQELCKKYPHWSVSGSDDPGEGEHKVMERLRRREVSEDPVLVYGLDADLILLTMLNCKSPAYLVRETSEMGLVQLNTFGEEEFSFFSLETLKQTLPKQVDILNYVVGMTLLGNDFLPHSLTMKIREDGHDKLCRSLERIKLVSTQDGFHTINLDGLYELLKEWEQEEDSRMLHTLKKKLQMRGQLQQTLENKPLEWNVEEGMVFKQDGKWCLTPEWKTIYNHTWLQCTQPADTRALCREYIYGLQWVLDYYTGQRAVNLQWCFPRLLPPLWCDLRSYLERNEFEEVLVPSTAPIQPQEQLAMVLPMESWHLIEDASLRSLPSLLPQFWPQKFGFFSAGRIRLWECEALLPILTVDRIRDTLKMR